MPGCRILSTDIAKITMIEWSLLFGLAASGLLAFTAITFSLKLISPNLVSSLRTLQLVLAFGVQDLVTGVQPDIFSCYGGGLIISGILILAFQDKISEMFEVMNTSRYVGFYQTVPAHYGYQIISD